ncbi:hypothetical protein IAT38_002729 [Cryptococcus sp. DSM 104549]
MLTQHLVLASLCLQVLSLLQPSAAKPLFGSPEVVFQSPNLGKDHSLGAGGLPEPPIGEPPFLTRNLVLYYEFNGVRYFTPHSYPAHSTASDALPGFNNFQPLTVISVPIQFYAMLTEQSLEPIVESYLEKDDVLTSSWFKTVLFIPEGATREGEASIDPSALVYLMRQMNTERIILDKRITINYPAQMSRPDLPVSTIDGQCFPQGIAGPYLARSEEGDFNLYPVSRLYPDVYRTFAAGIYPLGDEHGTYRTLDRVDEDGNRLIPVPSKLYALASDKELTGTRVAVKDIYDIKGVRTGAGSRIYKQWRGDVNQTASSIQRLERLGCSIVGKVKTAQFLTSGETVEETFEELYPFSPRGDKYQSCGSSSSGPACAVAAYDWIDFAIGSDTGGSVRGPAALTGLYGNRPTTGMLSLDGVLPQHEWSDTAGIFSRSPSFFRALLNAWYASSTVHRRHTHFPSRLVVPSENLAGLSDDLTRLITGFLQGIENVLGADVEMVNMTVKAEEAGWTGSNIDETLASFYHSAQVHEWKNFGKALVEDYGRDNDGRFPPVGSISHDFLKEGRDIPWGREQENRLVSNLTRFGVWFNGEVLGMDHETCSKAIFTEPFVLDEVPAYRELRITNERTPMGPRNSRLPPTMTCSMAGCPHYVVPVGHVEYYSPVSEHKEMHPVTMSLIAYPGCDSMLLDLIDRLEKAGILKEVKTGRTAFEVDK